MLQISVQHLQYLKQNYVFVVTLSSQNKAKLLQQLKTVFKRIINWKKYTWKPELLRQNENLNHLIELNFQVINRLFVFSLENDSQRTSNKIYYLPNVEIKDYNVVIDGKKQSANKKMIK